MADSERKRTGRRAFVRRLAVLPLAALLAVGHAAAAP